MKGRVAVVLGVLVLVVVGWWWTDDLPVAEPARRGGGAPSMAAGPELPPRPVLGPEDAGAIPTNPFLEEEPEQAPAPEEVGLRGRCVNPQGSALAGVLVGAVVVWDHPTAGRGLREISLARTGERGFFFIPASVLAELGLQTVDLRFRHAVPGHTWIRTLIGVARDVDLGDVDVGTLEATNVVGSVRLSDGAAVAGVEVSVRPDARGPVTRVTTDAGGNYEIRGLSVAEDPRARFVVMLFATEVQRALSRDEEPVEVAAIRPDADVPIEGGPGVQHTVHFLVETRSAAPVLQSLDLPVSLVGATGRVLGRNGIVLAAPSVFARRVVPTHFTRDEVARYGPLVLEVELPTDGSILRHALRIDTTARSATVDEGGTAVATEALEGRVVDGAGLPVAGATVVVNAVVRTGYATMNYRTVSAAASGEFRVMVPPGAYHLAAVRAPGVLEQWALLENPTMPVRVPAESGSVEVPVFP